MSGEDNRDPDRLEIPVYSDADVQRAIALKIRMQHELDRRHKKRNSAWTRLKRKLLGLPGH